MSKFVRTYSGKMDTEITEREVRNRKIARKAAAEGIVLLKNEGLLPLKPNAKAVVLGKGAYEYVKGGTGSGDVNERQVVDISEGLSGAGIDVLNIEDLNRFKTEQKAADLDWGERLVKALEKASVDSNMNFFAVLASVERTNVRPIILDPQQMAQADAVIYVISRISGEGFDRKYDEGDYQLSEEEKTELEEIAKHTDRIAVLINTGAQIEIRDLVSMASVKSLLFVSQGGMEGGNAVADVLTGAVTPSGKLTASWAVDYWDYPSSPTFSHNNGDTSKEYYSEGIYVGYRYFDSFDRSVLYPFGYGMSYTDFSIDELNLAVDGNQVCLSARITNTGKIYSGKEVLQVYAVKPQKRIRSEFKSLVGFAKTPLLAPQESCIVKVTIDAKNMAVFDDSQEKGRWILEAGEHILLAGNSFDNLIPAAVLNVPEDCILETVDHLLPVCQEEKDRFKEITRPDDVVLRKLDALKNEMKDLTVAHAEFCPKEEVRNQKTKDRFDIRAEEIADQMSEDELIAMLMGEISKGQDNIKSGELVSTGIFVPGAAGETSCAFEEKYEIPAVSMADGPAGLRLLQDYEVDRETGLIYGQDLLYALMGRKLPKQHHENADTYHMYATAIPIGTLLAQSFDMNLLEEIGRMIAEEMKEFHVSWWLAPGLNIQRNPLCGRNFEYYSEDPLVSGKCAAAITKGVQKVQGCGTTIKHFACNNNEDNRDRCDSIVGERALRQIYLRGFEIAVKEAKPACIMTSYNKINGVYTCNSRDLCTEIARNEWGFGGIIMTDWTTTKEGCADAYLCAVAGNDLIMPGMKTDVDNMKAAFRNGKLTAAEAKACASRLIAAVLRCKEGE